MIIGRLLFELRRVIPVYFLSVPFFCHPHATLKEERHNQTKHHLDTSLAVSDELDLSSQSKQLF